MAHISKDRLNEHTQAQQRQSGFGNQTWTARVAPTQEKLTLPFSADSITNDLTFQVDKPIWPLSSYGAAKHEPTLIAGLDESPEELRVRAVAAIKSGNLNDYLKYESDKINAADQVFANARANIQAAYDEAVRLSGISGVAATLLVNSTVTGSAFGTGPSTSSVFGQPSAFGTSTTTTTSAFGAPTAPPSAFGKSAFGQPAFGQSAFGQTSAPAPATSAFSQPQQPSAFGQTSQPQSSLIKPATGAFGSLSGTAPSAFGGGGSGGGGGFSAFAGQPSAFGLNTGATNTAAPQTGGSVFGQPAFGVAPAQTQPSAFGAPAQGSTTAPAFGATSAFGALPQQPVSAFGGSAFSVNQNSGGSVFGAGGSASGSAFSNNNPTTSPFAPQSQPSYAFAPPQQQPPQPPQSVFAPPSQPAQSSSAFASQNLPPAFASQIKPPPAGPPDFLNAKSTYKPGLTNYDLLLPSNYIELVPATALEAFKSQKFEWGKVPEWIPPMELR